MTVIGALGSPSTPLCSWMPATTFAAPLGATGLALAPPEAEIAMPATTRTTATPAAPSRRADAAAAGFGDGGGALGGPALLTQLALGLRHFGCSFGIRWDA